MHAELLSRRSHVTHRLRTVATLVYVLAVANNCSQSGDTSSAEEPRGSVGSPSPSQGMPLVVVPTDSPRFKQLRVELVHEHAFPTDEVMAPAKLTINPNRISRVMPPVQGREPLRYLTLIIAAGVLTSCATDVAMQNPRTGDTVTCRASPAGPEPVVAAGRLHRRPHRPGMETGQRRMRSCTVF